jgi:hypothetical protein
MPSLLVNERMDPALQKRVLTSLHSDARGRAGGENQRRGQLLVRLLVLGGVLILGLFLSVTFRRSRAEFARAKVELSAQYRREVAPLDQKLRAHATLVDELLQRANTPYQGDLIDGRLQTDRGLAEVLDHPLIYVRGPLRGFQTQRDRRTATEESGPDALVRCLLVPPAQVNESALLRHLGQVYQPRAFVGRFVNMGAGYQALEFLDSGFELEIEQSTHMKQLTSLAQRLRKQQLDRATELRDARLFMYVLDEPKAEGVAADFDGEAEHFLRVMLADLDSGRALLRQRKQVDPQWISEKSRVAYSRELDSCRLALELRQQILGSKQVPSEPVMQEKPEP